MQFILRNKYNNYIKLDFIANKSSGWCSSIEQTEKRLGVESAHSWKKSREYIAANDIRGLLDYMTTHYTIISTDVKESYEFW